MDFGDFSVSAPEAERLVEERAATGWHILRLPREIASRREFFEAVRNALPLDPPLLGDSNWDALDDSLWGGLDELAEDRIVILWPGASTMERMASEDFAIALEILAGLPVSLSDFKTTAGAPKQLLVLRVMDDR